MSYGRRTGGLIAGNKPKTTAYHTRGIGTAAMENNYTRNSDSHGLGFDVLPEAAQDSSNPSVKDRAQNYYQHRTLPKKLAQRRQIQSLKQSKSPRAPAIQKHR